MLPWIGFALLAAAAVAAIAWPLARRMPAAAGRQAYDRAVFRDQLAELERDAARGLIGPAEAEAARNEIARRLLAAKDETGAPKAGSRVVALAALALIPAAAVGVYMAVGHPHLPDVPRQPRIDAAIANQDMPALVAKVEDHLAANPDDLQGWQVLAPAYRDMQRYQDAANAYANRLRLAPPEADLFADYAEMLVLANEGLVSADANQAFGEALRLDSGNAKARYYSGLGLRQEGKTAEALAQWRALLADSAPDASWRSAVEAEIAAAGAPGPTAEQVAAASGMDATDRQAMIRGMVDGLEEKLKANGADAEGWQRLIRARMVLGEPDKASAAYAAARAALKDKPDMLASLEGLARELGVAP